MEDKSKDFFISYTKKDEDVAKWMVDVLKENGFSCFCQYKDIKPGQNFLLEMDEAIDNCDNVISILSEAYLQSFYAKEEWTAFLAKKQYANIIPVRIENIKPTGLWAARVYIDIAGKKRKEAKTILLKELAHLKKEIGKTGNKMPVNNLPDRNPKFTGRDGLLDSIHKALQTKNEALLVQAQTITGMGGIGKSETAKEYAYRYRNEYGYIWWVNAETDASREEAYRSFARRNDLGTPDDNSETVISNVKNWMRENTKWLFIFDNAEDEKSLTKYCSSSGEEGQHILVTSRNRRFQNYAPINIDIFTEEEACNFIKKYTLTPPDEHFRELAKRMGYLPLALDQAGAYMAINGLNYREYLELYKENSLDLLKEYDDDPEKKTVATTWKISIDKIKDEASIQLLNLCAFFAPDNIDKKWFQKASDVLSDKLRDVAINDLKYNKAISKLTQYSLVTQKDNALSLHRLLQEVIRDSLKDEQTLWRNYCVNILKKIIEYKFDTAESRARFLLLVPHITSVINDINDKDATAEVASLYYFLGKGFYELADYLRALKYHEKALDIRKKVLDKKHLNTSNSYHEIGLVYNAQGDYDRALKYYGKALAIYKKVLGTGHSYTATTYNNMARVYNAQGDYDRALKYYGKALAIVEKVLGTEHPYTATTYNNMALVYDAQGDYDRALEYYKKAEFIRENVLGTEHPDTATTYNNMASVYYAQGDYDRALEYHKKALVIREKVLGKEHPDTANTYNNMAGDYYDQGDYDRALEYYKRALPVFIKVLGIEHPNTKIVFNSTASAYEASKKDQPFIEWLTQILTQNLPIPKK
ncbi:MAG: tetratricopeptide repeat protein [Tannerella sp.]|jgi:tetratricopeptide (TPR) repeat protein|nr:tetratricopeptide repeat protein [Tannerella sp.]